MSSLKRMEELGIEPTNTSWWEKTGGVLASIGKGVVAAPVDAGASVYNKGVDIASAVDKTVHIAREGTTEGYEDDWARASGLTDYMESQGQEIGLMQNIISEGVKFGAGMAATGATGWGQQVLKASKDKKLLGKAFAELKLSVPSEIAFASDSKEHLFFDSVEDQGQAESYLKNAVEGGSLGTIFDIGLRGVYKGIKGGKTSDDVQQAVIEDAAPAVKDDTLNKVKPTAELDGVPEKTYVDNPDYKIENRNTVENFNGKLQAFETQLVDAFNLPKEQAAATSKLISEVAKVWGEANGKDPEEWFGFIEGISKGTDVKDEALKQFLGAKGFQRLGSKYSVDDVYQGLDALEASGKTADEINEMTGWHKGVDGNWKYEIDDSSSKILVDNAELKQVLPSTDGVSLSSILDHEELFRAYPYFRDVKVQALEAGSKAQGSFNPDTGILKLSVDNIEKSNSNVRSVVLHELQHAVQAVEGFSRGSSGEARQIKQLKTANLKHKINKELSTKEQDDYYRLSSRKQSFEKLDPEKNPKRYESAKKAIDRGEAAKLKVKSIVDDMEKPSKLKGTDQEAKALAKGMTEEQIKDFYTYQRVIGETEARNVQSRLDLSPEERRIVDPLSTQDIPSAEQLKPTDDFDIFFQKMEEVAKAQVTFKHGKAFIEAFESSDISSALHELGHVIRLTSIQPQHQKVLNKWVGAKEGAEWTVKQEEQFARGWERWLRTGKTTNKELQPVFAQMKKWLTKIYTRIKGSPLDIKLTKEVRQVFDELVGGDPITKQMANVSNAEYNVRKQTQKSYEEATNKKGDPLQEKVPPGADKEDLKEISDAEIHGKQDREDWLNMYDYWAGGGYSDDVEREAVVYSFLKQFVEDTDLDLFSLRGNKLKGKERIAAMEKVRKKIATNPFVLDERNFKDKARILEIISKELNMVPKKRMSVAEKVDLKLSIYKHNSTDKEFAKALVKLAEDTGLREDTLMNNMAELGIVTDRMSEYTLALTDMLNKKSNDMADLANKALDQLTSEGGLDVSDKAMQDWITAFGSGAEAVEGISGFRGNIARAMRMMQEGAGTSKSFAKQHGSRLSDLEDEVKDEIQSSFMKAKSLMLEQRGEPGAVKQVNAELIRMLKASNTPLKARRLMAEHAEEGLHDKTLTDLFIAQGISNLLVSPATLTKIAGSTALFTGYKQTLLPAFQALVNEIGRATGKGTDTGHTFKGVLRRWAGMAQVAKSYMVDYKNISKTSRGFLGMEIEGMGFSGMSRAQRKEHFESMYANSATKRFAAKILDYPMMLGNFAMSGLKGIDDAARRMMLAAETEGSLLEMYTAGTRPGVKSVGPSFESSFDNFEDYRKAMLPLMNDVRQALFDARDEGAVGMAQATDKIFDAFGENHAISELKKSTIMKEIIAGERKAAEAVSQETVSDDWLGKHAKNLSKIFGDTPLGRLTISTLMPFRTAPINIMRASFEETPGLNLLSKRWWDKYKSFDPKARREAQAQVLGGMTVMGSALSIANSVPVYGHIPPEEIEAANAAGIQPYSIVLDGKSISLDVLGPFKLHFALASDFYKYEQGGDTVGALGSMFKTSMLTYSETPYTDSVMTLGAMASGELSQKQAVSYLSGKLSQNFQWGSGIMRSVQPLVTDGAVETSNTNPAMHEYHKLWVQKIDNSNKSNPIYRLFRNMTDPQAYTTKTNYYGDNVIRNDLASGSYLPYILLGSNSMPTSKSPGILRAKSLGLMTADWSKVGDVVVSNSRANEMKRMGKALGVDKALDAMAMDPKFTSMPESKQKEMMGNLLKDVQTKVQSNYSLKLLQNQLKIDNINTMIDYESRNNWREASKKGSNIDELRQNLEINKIKKGVSEGTKAIESLTVGD